MQFDYQYFYTEQREPRVTVCYLKSLGCVDVGVAVCSWHDRPNKALGRTIATGRAIKSRKARLFGDGWQGHPCGRSAERVLAKTDMDAKGWAFITSGDGGMAFSFTNPTWRFERNLSKFFPRIVCLCGPTRFKEDFVRQNVRETLKGRIVLSIGCDMHVDTELFGHLSAEKRFSMREKLDKLRKRKIDLADEILVLDVGYIDPYTADDIAYAKYKGKRVRYLSKEQRKGRGNAT